MKTSASGILLVNKPAKMTSHDVVNFARKKLRIRKIGHTGTLDPFATGLLILLVGRQATKLQERFLKLDKTYLATALWGYTSDTYDITGKIQQSNVKELNALSNLETVLKKFQGKIVQTVPAFSAVKLGGTRLYKLARQGRISPKEHIEIKQQIRALPKRTITIHCLKLTDRCPPDNPDWKNFKLENKLNKLAFSNLLIECSSGTYIRSLIHDLGEVLGSGALCGALQRIKIGSFDLENAIELEDISLNKLQQIA